MSCSSTTASPRGPDISWRTVTKHISPERPCFGSMRAMRESRLTSSPMRSVSWNSTRLPANMRLGRGTGGMNWPLWGWPSGPSRDCRSSGVNRTTYQPLGIASPRRYGLGGTSSMAARRLIAARDTSSLACRCLPIHSWRVSAMALPEIQRGVLFCRHYGPGAFCWLNYFQRRELIELLPAHPEQIAEYFVGMLSEEWRGQHVFDWRFGKSHRARDGRAGHACGMRDFNFQPAVLHLGILEYFLVVVDRTTGHVRRFEAFDPVLARAPLHDFPDERDQLGAVPDAPGHGGIAGIRRKLGPACDPAETRELAVVAHGEDEMAVGGSEHFVGHDVRVRVAVAPRDLSRGEIVQDLVRAEGDDGVEQGEVDVLPDAGALAVRDGRRDCEARVHPGADVGDGDPHFRRTAPRLAVALAGDAHQPAHALEDEVVARTVRAGAGLAEPGDRAVDDARIDSPQIGVSETVFCEAADLVVLEQHVALRGERARDALAVGLRDVERHRLLAAVHRKEIGRFARLPAVLVLEEGRAPAARVVARPGAFDLEHFRAEVGEILRCPGPGENARKIENSDVGERARHGGSDLGPADYIGERREPGRCAPWLIIRLYFQARQ